MPTFKFAKTFSLHFSFHKISPLEDAEMLRHCADILFRLHPFALPLRPKLHPPHLAIPWFPGEGSTKWMQGSIHFPSSSSSPSYAYILSAISFSPSHSHTPESRGIKERKIRNYIPTGKYKHLGKGGRARVEFYVP